MSNPFERFKSGSEARLLQRSVDLRSAATIIAITAVLAGCGAAEKPKKTDTGSATRESILAKPEAREKASPPAAPPYFELVGGNERVRGPLTPETAQKTKPPMTATAPASRPTPTPPKAPNDQNQELEVTLNPAYGAQTIVAGEQAPGKLMPPPDPGLISSAEAAAFIARIAEINESHEPDEQAPHKQHPINRFGPYLLGLFGILALLKALRKILRNRAGHHEIGPEATRIVLGKERQHSIPPPGRNGKVHPPTTSSSAPESHPPRDSLHQ